jgi:guanylate kinase
MARGIAITGLLGVGKSSLARKLAADLGMTIIPTLVTRPTEPAEAEELISIEPAEFIDQVRAGSIVLPFYFGGHWYGYSSSDWGKAVRTGGAGLIFNVRPYTGLCIAAILSYVLPIWLALPEDVRMVRLSGRGAKRDRLSGRSKEADLQDGIYQRVYPTVLDATNLDLAIRELKRLTDFKE